MKPVNAGELRNPVQLQSVAYAPDANGERAATWTTFATVWMSLKGVSGREQERASTIVATATHVGKLRYQSAVNTQSRVKFGTRIFDINSVINVEERNVELILSLTEVIT